MNHHVQPSVRTRSVRRRVALALVILVAILAPGSTALAASAAQDAYCGPSCFIPPSTHVVDGGSLPFTGLDVGVVLLGGVLTLGVGVGIRRLSRRIN